MKIGHITGTFPKISETFILNQLAGLINNGHDIHVYASKSSESLRHGIVSEYGLLEKATYYQTPGSYPEGFKLLGATIPGLLVGDISPLKIFSALRYGKQAPSRLSLMRAATRHRKNIDVFHAHFGYNGSRFLPTQSLLDIPLIVSFYGSDVSRVLHSNTDVYDDLFNKAHIITCLSNDMKRDLRDIDVPPEKIHKIPLCIDTRKFKYNKRQLNPDEPIKILSIARFVEKKGLQYAIKAVANLNAEKKISYTIAGDGKRRERIEELIERFGVSDRVELVGWKTQEEIKRLMADAHLFLLPSVTAEDGDKEGTPTVLLEAQSAGLPVISTAHAGIPEIVDDGNSGILVPERDATALTDALRELIDRPDKWPEMGRVGRSNIETHHSIESVADELINIYDTVTS